MPDEQIDLIDDIEDHVGLTQPDASEETIRAESVTAKHLFIDGGDGKEKEVTLRSHHAGASSEAPASSGIPSAMTQSGVRREAFVDQDRTPMANQHEARQENMEP